MELNWAFILKDLTAYLTILILMAEVPEAMNQGAIVYAKMMVDKKETQES